MANPTTDPSTTTDNNKRRRLEDDVQQPVLYQLVQQQSKIEKKLLSVELFDKDGDVMWSCDDLRTGHYTRLQRDVQTPGYEEPPSTFWRKHVWTLPVQQRNKHGRTEFEIYRQHQVHKVRIGLHEWTAKIGEDIGLDFEYDKKTQTVKTLSLPMVQSHYSPCDHWDCLGTDGLYITGTYAVTHPEMIALWEEDSDNDDAWEQLQDNIPRDQVFPGVHDELRVREVHLAISGNVKNTLKLFNLYDEKWVEEPEADPPLPWDGF